MTNQYKKMRQEIKLDKKVVKEFDTLKLELWKEKQMNKRHKKLNGQMKDIKESLNRIAVSLENIASGIWEK